MNNASLRQPLNAEACYQNGEIYLQVQNYPAAFYHFKLAFRAGSAKACTALAELYMHGSGVHKDWRMVQLWLLRAINNPIPDHRAMVLYARSEPARSTLDALKLSLCYLRRGVKAKQLTCIKESIKIYQEIQQQYGSKENLRNFYRFLNFSIECLKGNSNLEMFLRLEQTRIYATYGHPIEIFNHD